MKINRACWIALTLGCVSLGAQAQQRPTSDILWRHTTTGGSTIWKGGVSTQTKAVAAVTSFDWQIVGVAVSRLNAVNSVIWRNVKDGRNVGWGSAQNDASYNLPTLEKTTWVLAGSGHFDTNTGLFDVLWRDSATGQNVIWRHGVNRYSPLTTSHPEWKVAGVGDFDGDGYDDVLWRNSRTGGNTIWKRANSATPLAVTAMPLLTWQVAGVGDFDANGSDDILWRNSQTGLNVIWPAGRSQSAIALPVMAVSWKVAGIGDFEGDGKSDVLWRDSATGRNVEWPSANGAAPKNLATVPDQRWVVAAIGDFELNPF